MKALRAGLDTCCSASKWRRYRHECGSRLLSLCAFRGATPARFRCVSFHAAVALGILLVSACAEKPLIVSADTSCEKFRHISATDEQIKVFADNWAVMESYADQILTHNAVYDAACLKEPK